MKKNLELERLVFFSDAVVAIAITLLALELKIDISPGESLTWGDLAHSTEKFGAFFLSFVTIAVFWKIHHEFFANIRAIDTKILLFNIAWLLFIVLIPFTTSLISAHFFDVPAMVCFCANVFLVTLFQNFIWDYAAANPEILEEHTDAKTVQNFKISCNTGLINAIVATALAFFSPILAALVVLFRLPMIVAAQRTLKK